MILADNGSAIYISGAPDSRWNITDLGALKTIAASSFDVVQMNTIYTSANVPSCLSPAISSFSASPASITSGQSTTLNWTVSDAIYNIISPSIGPVRVPSLSIMPTTTTTYTLYSTNQYGRTIATVKVTVQ